MKNVILTYCLILSTLCAQVNKNIFNTQFQFGIGINKLHETEKGPNPSILLNSNLGYNLSIGALLEFSKFTNIQFSTGLVYKLHQIQTRISGIITEETIRKGWDPIVITESYLTSYLSIPLLVNFRIRDNFSIGAGASFDYLFDTKGSKTITNNTSPYFERLNSSFNPSNHSFIFFSKYKLKPKFTIVPTISLSPLKTISPFSSNSTGVFMRFDIHFELRL